MRIAFDDALSVMREKLVDHGTSPETAGKVAYEMARNSLEGTYTHGINRFARLVRGIDSGIVIPGAEPTLISSFGAIERYDGNRGFGITNALFAMDRAMAKASEHGIGMAGLVNTNHWMRAATYGYHAVEKGYAAICFTNTIPNMPAWGAVDSRLGNNNLKDFLESQDCEVMLPPMLGFVFYGFTNGIHDAEFYGGRKKYSFLIKNIAMPYLEKFERWMIEAIERHEIFHRPATFKELEEYGKSIISPGCKMGEGWLLTAEMVELVEKGYGNIVCTQPFGCLPNHICGKGMIRPIKERYPQSNIVPIDYDPSATKVNQENRIKLMLSIARENLENEKEK